MQMVGLGMALYLLCPVPWRGDSPLFLDLLCVLIACVSLLLPPAKGNPFGPSLPGRSPSTKDLSGDFRIDEDEDEDDDEEDVAVEPGSLCSPSLYGAHFLETLWKRGFFFW